MNVRNLCRRGTHAAAQATALSLGKAARLHQHPDSVIIIDITGA